MAVPMSGRTRYSQYFDADGTWIRGYWRVINGTAYKFGRAETAYGDVVLSAMSLAGPYSHMIVCVKQEEAQQDD